MKSIFSRHGIPYVLITDNGPPFNSKEFQQFCKNWEIEHKTSSPYLPRSNGLAERSVQTIKKLFIKSYESNSDPYIALLHYRTAPQGNLPSPAEHLMSRSLKTKIPSISKNFHPKVINRKEYKRKLNLNIQKYSKYHNKRTKKFEPVQEGDNVMFKRTPTSCWFPGHIVSTCKEPRSFVLKDNNGSLYRRNQDHIRKTPENKTVEKQNTFVRQENNQPNIELTTESNNDNYITRTGRIVKPPDKLNL